MQARFTPAITIPREHQHRLCSTILTGLDPGLSVNARKPETLQPPLASVEVEHPWAS